ncbi:MAG: membrane protein insertase YidC [Syntrophales bacterium]|jgi:YidC/Oxa1 family membrane protein insertase|nr:membrane protein insertase YidC [Syntrophales bacterium]HOG08295.1 membrane protein insertase YidC [Syntrophales bacterium]HOS77738.1 membrane protein insertase YidC [Syntrophales bacterium]HPB70296.1 membrane protein insertase YidC [Syntrophales bacterium]HQN25543.1 membrane protein insertase YidC [Syntrophales bacterium]
MDKRTFLAIVLSLAVIFVYQAFFVKPVPQRKPAATPPPQTGLTQPDRTASAPPPSPAATSAPPVAPLPAVRAAAVAERDVTVETPLYTAVLTTRGGALKSFQLKGYRTELPEDRRYGFDGLLALVGFKKKEEKPALPVELVHVQEGMPRPLTVSFPDSSLPLPAEGGFTTGTTALDLTTGTEGRPLVFTQILPGTARVEKIYTFRPDRYVVDLEVRVRNLSGNPLNQHAALNWRRYVDPKAETDRYGNEGPVTYVAKSIDRIEVKKIEREKIHGPDVSWGGFESKYFLAAMIPQNPSLSSVAIDRDTRDMVTVSLRGANTIIPAGQSGSFVYSVYLGPKDYTILEAQGVGLENAIDFGSWLKWLAFPLLIVLKFLYQYIPNYGIAIIILTALIKLVFWPLGNKSYQSMKEMQKLQPKLKALQEKYKDDKAKISQETMALYKAHKVNPLGGCLPMIIQIPVFFGLYKALLYAIELRHSPFFWWIQDLSARDPYFITPLIMGATMFIQQKMSPAPGDPMQAKLMLWMPVIFTFLFLYFPSGLVIYWLFNNLFSIGQQYYINQRST